ncbi:MAG: hypothetical protein JO040_05505 [Gemmatimonadetes bacterium]|nr:hypothetical protein [Gemmatimonadota bacterium]
MLEAIRAWVEVRRRDTPLRDLALEIGIGKSSVDKLVRERSVPHKNLPKLTRWFIRDRRERYGSLPTASDVAVLVVELLANVPTHERADALRRTAEFLEALHDEKRAPRPEWLPSLRELADAWDAHDG